MIIVEESHPKAPGVSQSVEDKEALRIVKSSVYKDGHYEVPLPWRTAERLPDNCRLARSRLQYIRRRFAKDLTLLARRRERINNSIIMGYLEPVSAHQSKSGGERKWYLTHHPVLTPRKPGQLRVVLDCAAKFKGVSLNDRLCKGPDTTASLTGVLSRFLSE
ncbi:hypothetical protein T265_08089 [Opisthorchis viverrini]|uniref:Uncharacterized protein n=1 Tax=Opisthorchis viverrini TaxID=6198 RepID=A0A074ZAS4_OPIVI|nr:hypothetical protein T265_08089 [Opisthorchis viverrini]KER24198.1 hypothetical protein T265_08089 [Opisthorchis viverrini]